MSSHQYIFNKNTKEDIAFSAVKLLVWAAGKASGL